MSWETTDVLSADTTDVLLADTTDVLSADTTDVLSADRNQPKARGKFKPKVKTVLWWGFILLFRSSNKIDTAMRVPHSSSRCWTQTVTKLELKTMQDPVVGTPNGAIRLTESIKGHLGLQP